jgi:tetratricopeptide (TPR) repeat protein
MMNIPTDTNLHSLAHAAALLLRSGRMQEAESVYRKILELDSENREALFITAQLLKSQGKESEAGTYERRFLALGPTLARNRKRRQGKCGAIFGEMESFKTVETLKAPWRNRSARIFCGQAAVT